MNKNNTPPPAVTDGKLYDLFDQGDNVRILTKVLVGSRLHGLDTPESDFDYRGIHTHSLKAVLSPFRTLKNTTWIEGDEDNTSYELADFCKLATKGNATILEVFFSDKIIETTPVIDQMRLHWQRFIDTHNFVMASLGYARNNKTKFEDRNPVGVKGQYRRNKFAIAYCRVLWQCREFLTTGEFKCQIEPGEFRDLLMKWKYHWSDEMTMEAIQTYYKLEGEVLALKDRPKLDLKPDIKWIERFNYYAYLEN
jgi:predicted nucleotidyltransferase